MNIQQYQYTIQLLTATQIDNVITTVIITALAYVTIPELSFVIKTSSITDSWFIKRVVTVVEIKCK